MYSVMLNNKSCIPVIGFGTWQIRLNNKAKKAVAEALEVGYRLIDTAHIYDNEKGVGTAIQASDVPRKDIFVTTKLWNWDQGYESTFKAFDKSLKKLGLEYIDLYLIHWPATNRRQESWRAMEEIHKRGKAKCIGVSNYKVLHLEELLTSSKITPSVNQIEFHPFVYEQQKPILEFCKKHGITVEAYSPLGRGLHVNDPGIALIAKQYDKSNAQILIRWALQHGTVPLPRSANPAHIKENYDVFNFKLSAKDMKAINSLGKGIVT